MNQSAFFDPLAQYLPDLLPQEWLVSQSGQTTCEGPCTFLRIDSETKAKTARNLICLVHITDEVIKIYSPNILSKSVYRVICEIKHLLTGTLNTPHLVLIECPLLCESCQKAKPFYEEIIVSP